MEKSLVHGKARVGCFVRSARSDTAVLGIVAEYPALRDLNF
jgi:hypothetical protein